MESNLHDAIKIEGKLNSMQIKFIVLQLLRGIKYIHSCGIIHRDLKPRNILINSQCHVQICDFGLARANINSLINDNVKLTDYIATRWYRAPEVMLGWKQYTDAVDIWSVGCIFTELFTGQVLLPAKDESELMYMINDLLGNQPDSFIDKIPLENSKTFM